MINVRGGNVQRQGEANDAVSAPPLRTVQVYAYALTAGRREYKTTKNITTPLTQLTDGLSPKQIKNKKGRRAIEKSADQRHIGTQVSSKDGAGCNTTKTKGARKYRWAHQAQTGRNTRRKSHAKHTMYTFNIHSSGQTREGDAKHCYR